MLTAELSDHLSRIGEAVVIASLLWFARLAWKTRQDSKERDIKIDRLLEFHEGIPPNKITGQPEIPGVAKQLENLKRQVTPNGGNSDTLADRVVRVEDMASEAVRQGQRHHEEIEIVRKEQDRCAKEFHRSEEERRKIMMQSLEGWRRFETVLGIDMGTPPWIEWTEKRDDDLK